LLPISGKTPRRPKPGGALPDQTSRTRPGESEVVVVVVVIGLGAMELEIAPHARNVTLLI